MNWWITAEPLLLTLLLPCNCEPHVVRRFTNYTVSKRESESETSRLLFFRFLPSVNMWMLHWTRVWVIKEMHCDVVILRQSHSFSVNDALLKLSLLMVMIERNYWNAFPLQSRMHACVRTCMCARFQYHALLRWTAFRPNADQVSDGKGSKLKPRVPPFVAKCPPIIKYVMVKAIKLRRMFPILQCMMQNHDESFF